MTTAMMTLKAPKNATIVGTHEYAGNVGTVLRESRTHVEIAFYDSRGKIPTYVGKRIISKSFIKM